MQATRVVPHEEHVVGAGEAPGKVREVLQGADVSKVSVRDVHGHTIVEVPVQRDEVGSVLEPVVAATRAIAETVGDVRLYVEKEPELTARAGPAQGGTPEERRAAARRMASGEEMPDDVTAEEVARSRRDAGAPTAVTEDDIERIRQANAVPTGSERTVRRTAPEQKGEPELKDTGEWPDRRQR